MNIAASTPQNLPDDLDGLRALVMTLLSDATQLLSLPSVADRDLQAEQRQSANLHLPTLTRLVNGWPEDRIDELMPCSEKPSATH